MEKFVLTACLSKGIGTETIVRVFDSEFNALAALERMKENSKKAHFSPMFGQVLWAGTIVKVPATHAYDISEESL